MVKLRPYQQDLLRQVQDALEVNAKARVMMQLPSCGGKTITAGARLAEGWTQGCDRVCGMGLDEGFIL